MALQKKYLLIVVIMAALVLVMDASQVCAGDEAATAQSSPTSGNQRRGFLLGLNGGVGGGSVSLQVGAAKVEDSRGGGFFGAWRAGYAVSNSIALTVEGRNYYRADSLGDWQMYGTFGVLTWWPDASGFSLRVGVGGGKVKTNHSVGDLEVPLEHEDSMIVAGLGYEWRVGRSLALGLNFDLFGGSERDENDIAELSFVSGGFSLQLNWYL